MQFKENNNKEEVTIEKLLEYLILLELALAKVTSMAEELAEEKED